MKTLLLALCLLVSCAAAPLHAQPATVPALEGRTLDGQPFQLATQRGKVVLVMFWSTACAVCRDKMPELRQNLEGWRNQPFALVLVSTDHQLEDLRAYERILARTVPARQRFVQLWAGDAAYRDGFGPQARPLAAAPADLPVSFLVDKSGRVVERWQGRIPPQAWDRIADLL